jgi:hypothetical protein
MDMTKEDLRVLIARRGKDFWGIRHDYRLGGEVFPSGHPRGTSHGYALALADLLGEDDTRMMMAAGECIVTGNDKDHRFVLYRDRYILDPWVDEVCHLTGETVFDLEDEGDLADVEVLYGNKETWKEEVS